MSPAQLVKLKQREQLLAQHAMLAEAKAAAVQRAWNNEFLASSRTENMRVEITTNEENGQRFAALTSFDIKGTLGQTTYHTMDQLRARRASLIADGRGTSATENAIRLLSRGVFKHEEVCAASPARAATENDKVLVAVSPKRAAPVRRRRTEKVAAAG